LPEVYTKTNKKEASEWKSPYLPTIPAFLVRFVIAAAATETMAESQETSQDAATNHVPEQRERENRGCSVSF
jgi:uncharacterized membrane protein YadS